MTFKEEGKVPFYIYQHIDPVSKEVMYLGVGQYDRAWSIRKNNRKEKHVKWLTEQYDKGFTLSDIVVIVANGLSKEEALEKELKLIKETKPMLNELGNPDHWQRNRKNNKETAEFAKNLHDMGYGYVRITYLLGGKKANHMTIKRMISYV
jgi:hypothetical protein